ncbi:(2Fe-2S)-binding protein [Streptomyces tateyamensis]|uniref:(2Fe-2S)-binding protein n=1 Tax=Streptomyces tateyamensis TaxID=565073 RepID=UPI000DA21403|nr:(2Fe-2S)-binding protein [Streptomyces tateyamensis]
MRTARTVRAPYAGAYTAFAQVFPELRIRFAPTRPERGWLPVVRLLADPALRARLLAAEARADRARYGTAPRPDVAAGFWLHRFAWPLGLLLTLPWLLERRVPLPTVDQLAFRPAGPRGGPVRLALLPPGPHRFACLPEDPAAHHPGAVPVPDRAALDAALRTGYAQLLTPLLTALRPQLRRGPGALWGLATDELVEGLWYAAGLLGIEPCAVTALSALLPGGTAPFTGGANFHPSGVNLERTRVSCCLFYTVRPQEACAGCPRRTAASDPARLAELSSHHRPD